MKTPSWKAWLKANGYKADLAMLTGQDARALEAVAACWQLCASSDEDGERGALAAVRALLPAMQPKVRHLARILIAFGMDWDVVDKLWTRVSRVERLE